ncbi:uncharacterized protein LOC114740167 [Neltuma alba]|uniref:uncharacterized protein LOC114740167 n=1 Tax=Neltuma alba TaxID=207710 RepID=UPI0010A4634E|nr:uncharacterized protein LOC114740167 [Prosopis alba]
MRCENNRKVQEKEQARKVEFASGGAQPIIITGALRISVPVAGFSLLSTRGLPLMPPTVEAANRDGRLNKKSKWDKVDGDRKNPLPFVGQHSVSTGGVHAAILSAAGGYYDNC